MIKPLILAIAITAIALAGPATTQLRAEDAHHPEKAGKAKKTAKPKPKPKKPPAADKSKQGDRQHVSQMMRA
jgi:hypothetical protein